MPSLADPSVMQPLAGGEPPPRLWQGAFAGWACLFVGIGIARFGYSPLIPILVQANWFTAAAADYLASINLAGYIVGAVIAGHLLAHRGETVWVRTALLGACACFLACFRPAGFTWFACWRFEGGVAAGLLMVLAVPGILMRTPAERRGLVGGFIFSGVGCGMVVSGAWIPRLATHGVAAAWLGMGGLGLLVTAAAWNYWPARLPVPPVADEDPPRPSRRFQVDGAIGWLMAAYVGTAVGYVPHSIFWVDYISRELGRGLHAGGAAYMELGLGAAIAPGIAGMLGTRFGFRRCLIYCLLIEAGAVAMAVGATALPLLALSAFLVGAGGMAATMLISARTGELAPTEVQKQAWGWMTVIFSTSYAGGAALLSLAYARIETYRPLFLAAAIALLAGSGCAALARRRPSLSAAPRLD